MIAGVLERSALATPDPASAASSDTTRIDAPIPMSVQTG
jgi:hypothetical protein